MTAAAAIVGAAFSDISRRGNVGLGALATQAITRALDDAGLRVSDVDGLCVYPAPSRLGAGDQDGMDFVGAGYVARALRLDGLRWCAQLQPGSYVGAVLEAAHAVAAGACSTVVVWRAMHNPAGKYGRYELTQAAGPEQFRAPFGLANTVMDYALPYSRYMARYGARREHMAEYVVRNRANTQLNPEAVFRGKPLTVEDYLNTRPIADPLSMLDCDMPVDGAGAVIVTSAARAADAPHPAAYVRGGASIGMNLENASVMTLESMERSSRYIADELWRSAGLGPADVDQVNIYDGFSYFVYIWLEAFGFCKQGEAFRFVADGETARDGAVPVNTSGGMLGMGRLHGTPQVIEAVRQIQGVCGERQLRRPVEVTMANSGSPLKSHAAIVLASEAARG